MSMKPIVDFAKTAVVGATRWLRLETLTYTDAGGAQRAWDRVVRTTKQSERSSDAVAILAVLQYGPDRARDQVVLVRQYRPPIDGFTIELPAGLIDKGETPAQAAAREFREETGYVGEVVTVSPPLSLSPGLTNESVQVVRMKVDMTKLENQTPTAVTDGCELARGLQTVLVNRVGLLQTLTDMSDREGITPFGMLYTFAMAMELEV